MNKFGQIKSNIESLLIESYGKVSFKNHMKSFKKNIIENEKLAEAYFLYDELTTKKGLSVDIVEDYVNESIEVIKKIINTEKETLKELNMWISENKSKNVINNYSNIDTVVYNTSVKNLEKVFSHMEDNSILVTYCSSGQFKRDLKTTGFKVEVLPGPKGKKEMVRASR